MENSTIKTRKIKLIYIGENKKEVYSYLRKTATDLSTIGNKVIRLHVNNLFAIDDYAKENHITKTNAKKFVEENLGTSIRNSGYQALSYLDDISSNIRTCFNSEIFKKISTDFFNILNNKISIPSFKKDNLEMPFTFGDVEFKLDEKNNYYLIFPTGMKTKKTLGEIKLNLFFGKDMSNNKVIVERILSKEYEVCISSIQVKEGDFYLLLTYKQPITKNENDPNKVMGIDLGINRAVSFYITDTKFQPRQLDNISLNIQHERMRMFKERKGIQSAIKYSTGGHGRVRKIQALEQFKEKESNLYKLKNHQISKEIINLALEHNVGTIKMEDLTGISKNSNEYFLKSWSYYQLQSFIIYKAKEQGINIIFVNPRNTSRTCNVCGNVDKLNRNQTDVKKFACTNPDCCDYQVVKDADINAAINIANSEGKSTKGNGKEARKEKQKEKENII